MKKLSFGSIRVDSRLTIAALAAPFFLLVGCETRSISDSGYRGRFAWESGNRYYRGELNEMDVLGTPAGQKVTETDIRKALAEGSSVHVHPGDSLLVIQSGAIAPDGAMVDALNHLGYRVQGFSGLRRETMIGLNILVCCDWQRLRAGSSIFFATGVRLNRLRRIKPLKSYLGFQLPGVLYLTKPSECGSTSVRL
jgi:hypothetical protein